MSPTVALDVFADLLILGTALKAGVVSVFELLTPEKAPDVNVALAMLSIVPEGGIAMTVILNTTVTVVSGAMEPRGIPFAGLALDNGVPFTVTLPVTNAAPAGIISLSWTFATLSIPELLTLIVYVIVSPTVVAVVGVVFTTLTFGADTGMVTVLDRALPVSVLPSGGIYVNAAVAWFDINWGFGSESITTTKVTVEEPPGAILPRSMPVTGEDPGSGKPLTMTLFGENVVEGGIVSVNVTAAAKFPELLTVME